MSGKDPIPHQPARPLRDPSAKDVVRIVHISDTHDQDYDDIPSGDILVHTGDWTNYGRPEEVKKFVAYLKRQPHAHKVIIAGNHEVGLDRLTTPELQELITNGGTTPNVHFLNDTSATVCGVKFYGSPWNNCSMAWPAPDPKDRAAKWEKIPADTDVLLTHNPPFGILDLAWVKHDDGGQPCRYCNGRTHRNYQHWGCWPMLQKVDQLKIPVHCFGHVHDEVGIVPPPKDGSRVTTFSNAAMDIKRRPCVIDVLVTDKSKTDPVPLTATQEKLLQEQRLAQASAKPASPPAQHGVTVTGAAQEAPSLVAPRCRLAPYAWSQFCVLDLDSHDKLREKVIFWKGSYNQVNQQWSVKPRPIESTPQTGPVVAIESQWNENKGVPDRALGLHFNHQTGAATIQCSTVGRFTNYPQECLWRWQVHDDVNAASRPSMLVSFESVACPGSYLCAAGSWKRGDLKPAALNLHQVQNNEHLWIVQSMQE